MRQSRGGLNEKHVELLLGRVVAYQTAFGVVCGDALTGLFLSQLWYLHCYWKDKYRKDGKEWDGWFYKKREELTEETCMSKNEQITARRNLLKLAFLDEKHEGMPRRLYFKLDVPAIIEALEEAAEQLSENQKTSHP